VAARSKIVDLRKLLAERFTAAPPTRSSRLPTGLALLDHATEGGLAQGAITEIVSPHLSAGSASLISGLVQAAPLGVHPLALVDGSDSFDPEPSVPGALACLLWLRCRHALEAIKVTDLLLRDGNFPLVILDLVLNGAEELRKIPATSWYRLQRLVEPSATAFLVLSRHSLVASAQLKLVLENEWALSDFENATTRERLRLRVRRSHRPANARLDEKRVAS